MGSSTARNEDRTFLMTTADESGIGTEGDLQNGAYESSKKFPSHGIILYNENARMGVGRKNRWRVWHLAKVGWGGALVA